MEKPPKDIVASLKQFFAIRAQLAAISKRVERKMFRAANIAENDPSKLDEKVFVKLNKEMEISTKALEVGSHKALAIQEILDSPTLDWNRVRRALERAIVAANRDLAAQRELEAELDTFLAKAAS
jgi:hypothetical protein